MATSLSSEAWCDSASNLRPEAESDGCASSRMRLRRRISTGSMPIACAARSTSPSVTEQAIGWPTARYWHITFLFWNTTRARAR